MKEASSRRARILIACAISFAYALGVDTWARAFQPDKGAWYASPDGNVRLGAPVLELDGEILFRNPDRTHWLFRTDKRSEGEARLFLEHSPSFMQRRDGYVYYVNAYYHSALFKARTDGGGLARLNDEMTIRPYVVGSWIYYASYKRLRFTLYQVSLDGLVRKKVNDSNCWMHQPDGRWLYFIDIDRDCRLFRLDLRGGREELVLDASLGDFQAQGDSLYYVRNDERDALYRHDLSSGSADAGASRLLVKGMRKFNVRGRELLYSVGQGDPGLYLMDLGGGSSALLTGDAADQFFFVDDYVIYINDSAYGRLYRVGLDGSGRRPFP